MLKPITKTTADRIVANVLKAAKNIESLNSTGYNFLYLASGFIAHYNLGGFKAHYSDCSLKSDILNFARFNQWTNFTPADRDYAYYQSKKAVYNRIVAGLQK